MEYAYIIYKQGNKKNPENKFELKFFVVVAILFHKYNKPFLYK